jgi:membrane protease YdiL (CAAX protease family)
VNVTLLRRHPVVAFVALSYLLSWFMLPFGMFLPAGPLIAAIAVVAATDGLPGLRRLAGNALRWRVRWVWYAVALGVPLALHLVAVAGNAAVGGAAPSSASLTPWYGLVMVFAVRLVNPLDGPLGEEPAWRGYALPSLQTRRSPLRSTAILCVLVTGWHLPLYFMSEFGLRPFDALTTVACTVFFVWLFNRSGGSALMTLIAHAAEGTVRAALLWPAEADLTRARAVYCAAWALVAVGLLLLDRRAWTQAPADATWPDAPETGRGGGDAAERVALRLGAPANRDH